MQRLTVKEIKPLVRHLSGWKVSQNELTKTYVFGSFLAAIAFVNFVADEAESMDHHPSIVIDYKEVTLTLSTHTAKGLTEKDFTLAHKIDR